jgi:hypothetical protein
LKRFAPVKSGAPQPSPSDKELEEEPAEKLGAEKLGAEKLGAEKLGEEKLGEEKLQLDEESEKKKEAAS